MRPRKWILILSIIVFVTSFLLYQGVKLIERNRNIETILIQQISELVGGSFSVEKVRLGFLAVYLQDVNISVPLQAFKIHIHDIKIGFALRKLIASGGDFSRCINKIIFVDPQFQIHLRDSKSSNKQISDNTSILKQEKLRKLPVSSILIKDGAFEIVGIEGKRPLVGGGLDGRVIQDEHGINVELYGRIASFRRNFSINAHIAPPGDLHRVSVRLKNARLRKSINLEHFAVAAGTIDGTCEFSFPDTNIIRNLQSNGYITVSDGKFSFPQVPAPVSDGNARLSLENSKLVVESVKSKWGDIDISARGRWDFADESERLLHIRCTNIKPLGFPVSLPPEIGKQLSGRGWLSARITQKIDQDDLQVKTSLGGLSYKNIPITDWQANWILNSNSVELKSLNARQDEYQLKGRGSVQVDGGRSKYMFAGDLHTFSNLFSPELKGQLGVSGQITGEGKDFSFEVLGGGDSFTYRDLQFDNVHLSIYGDEEKLTFGSVQKDSAPGTFSVSGDIHSPWGKKPHINSSFSINTQAIETLLHKIPGSFSVNNPYIEGNVVGLLGHPEIKGRMHFDGNVSGDINFQATLSPKAHQPHTISLDNSVLQYNGVRLPLNVQGDLFEDSLVIKSIEIANHVTGTAGMDFDKSEDLNVLLTGNSIPLSLLDTLFLNEKNVFRKGTVDINVRLSGKMDEIRSSSRIHVRDANIGGIDSLETDLVIAGQGDNLIVHPFVVRKDRRILVSVDSLKKDRSFFIAGELINAELADFILMDSNEDLRLEGAVSASFTSTDSGFPITIEAEMPALEVNEYSLVDVNSQIELDSDGVCVRTITASDSTRLSMTGGGSIPWSFISGEENERDTMYAYLRGKGDLLAVISRYVDSPIGGKGAGTIDIEAFVNNGKWALSKADIEIEKGVLTLFPFVQDEIEDFNFHSSMADLSRLTLRMEGKVRKRLVRIFSSHDIPEGIEPIMIGPVNAGVLLADTPDEGIHVHLPGFMVEGDVADVEFAGREPFDRFAVSGPIDRLQLTGTWIIRDVEFTFPFLTEEVLPWPFDPFPYITWDMDIKIGNRNVMYFYDVGMRKRLMRVVEAFVDPNGEVQIRGRDLDRTFRIYGGLRSYRGAVYYGKTFNRTFEVGVDFIPEPFPGENGFENLPFIWGSAEAFSDTSRFERVKLALLTKDPETGTLSEKGRFNEITFRLSSDFDEIPGESEREFYRQAGLRVVTFEGAGGFFSNFGEQYLHRYFLQRIERRLARRLGLDVISFETSIASNYFYYLYNNNFQGLAGQWDNLALANVGVTVGRYLWRDRFFLKWRTELVPSDTLIHPEHSLGLEYYPMRYLVFDVSYGFHRGENDIEHNPKLNMQLRLPITRFRKVFDF